MPLRPRHRPRRSPHNSGSRGYWCGARGSFGGPDGAHADRLLSNLPRHGIYDESVMSYADTHPLQRTPWARYRHSLWLLTTRDLKVRYSTSALGYVWSVLDPLVMA